MRHVYHILIDTFGIIFETNHRLPSCEVHDESQQSTVPCGFIQLRDRRNGAVQAAFLSLTVACPKRTSNFQTAICKQAELTMKRASANGTAASQKDPVKPDMWFVEYLTPYDAYHHGVKEILHVARTPLQAMTVADTGVYGRALFLDGMIQVTENDEALYHEPIVHAPAVSHGAPKNVLILGGADGGAAREALRWRSVERVVVVDIDGAVVDACRQFLPRIARGSLDDPRCEVVIGDALDYIESPGCLFDVVICDLTDPLENGPSLALFTVEFFRKVRAVLTRRAAISIQCGSASLIERPKLFPRICTTLSAVFEHVYPYQVFVPTYGTPMAMAVASDSAPETSFPPSASEVDSIFRNQVAGEFHVLDGRAFSGMFGIPRCVSQAIAAETHVYTNENIESNVEHGFLT